MKGIYVYVCFVPKMVLDNIKMKETQGPDTCPPDMKQPSLGYYSLPSAHPHHWFWEPCSQDWQEVWAAHILLPHFHVLLRIIWVELTSHILGRYALAWCSETAGVRVSLHLPELLEKVTCVPVLQYLALGE